MKRKHTKKISTESIPTRVLVAQTLEMMKLAERTEEFGDCHLWTGSTTEQGYPTYKPFGCGCKLVRRAMFELNGGVLAPRVPIVTTCGEKLCINPVHLKSSTVSAVGKEAGKRGGWKTKTRCAKIAASKRKTGKLTMEIARTIRMSSETGPVLAARHGTHRSLVTKIKSGDAWKDYSSPFAGLMA